MVEMVMVLQLPSERLQTLGIYGHAFANGGSATLVGGTGRDVRSCLQDFGSKFRWTVVSFVAPYDQCVSFWRRELFEVAGILVGMPVA